MRHVTGPLCLSLTGQHRRVIPRRTQALRMRRAYVQCILKQDIGWFDANPAGQIPTTVTANMAKVQDGLGRKIGDIVLNGLSGKTFFFF